MTSTTHTDLQRDVTIEALDRLLDIYYDSAEKPADVDRMESALELLTETNATDAVEFWTPRIAKVRAELG